MTASPPPDDPALVRAALAGRTGVPPADDRVALLAREMARHRAASAAAATPDFDADPFASYRRVLNAKAPPA